ncbi:MAG: hypothetical protein WC139_06185 [Candidatus Kapaibacterium sp.]
MIKKILNIAVVLLMGSAGIAAAQDYISFNVNESETKLTLSNIVSDEFVPQDTFPSASETELLNRGYDYTNKRMYNEAINSFNQYLRTKPGDAKIHLQLGYLYDANRKYENSYNSFGKVLEFSNTDDEIDKATISRYYMREKMIQNSVVSLDFYFYNFYDTYYQNYVGNLLAHLNVKIAKGIHVGPYLDTYFDSKSTALKPLNDRYFEIGAFTKFSITDWMSFEVRTGYVREIDKKVNSFSFKPILSMGKRLGTAHFYKPTRSQNTESFYYDIYVSALYDYKFRNIFVNWQNKEALRFMLAGYSYFEFYLKQEIAADTKGLDYNNYLDFGAGVSFKPNIQSFPVLFVEGVYRNFFVSTDPNTNKPVYFTGDMRSFFTVRAGFLLYYNTKL